MDSGLLSQVISELNIARKNFAIYPLGHSQIAISVDKALRAAFQADEFPAALVLGAAKDHIFTDNSQLDFKNPVHREFAHALHSLNIAAISFANGLTKQELCDFLKVIAGGMEVREAAKISLLAIT